MGRGRLPSCASVAALTLSLTAFGACGSDNRPSSLVTGSGGSSPGGHVGNNAGAAGNGHLGATGGGGNSNDGGDPGEGGATSALPVAVFPSTLEADVGCNMVTPDASLLIRNTGDQPLVIATAKASAGYTMKTTLPLSIEPASGGTLVVTPAAPSANAKPGSVSMGKLSFTTNEPGMPTHDVTLITDVFEGSFEFTDSNGTPITTLSLSYDSGGACADPTKYRLHNTGNVAFTVSGPTFATHFSGTNLGASGRAIPPDGYAELIVGPQSSPGTACSAAGDLSFTVMGAFCGAVPKLSVDWARSTDPDAGSSCACTVPTE
jgi:hypothetical protein